MSSNSHQSLRLTITPQFDEHGNASAFVILMRLESPSLETDSPFLELFTQLGNVPTQRYDRDAIQASDTSGTLPLHIQDTGADGNLRRWLVTRATKGDVAVRFRALPRIVNAKTPTGPRIDLRLDQGGLQGGGYSFIPIPPDNNQPSKLYRLIVQWDLTQAPAGTRAVWTFGEGPAPVVKLGPASLLTRSQYMAGPVRSYPPASQLGANEHYGFYWFGDPPNVIARLAQVNMKLFKNMSKFFQDTLSASNPYRIFVRREDPSRGFGGSAFTRSYVLAYDSVTISDIRGWEIFSLLAHEIVHNWPLLEGNTSDEFEGADGWYNEGIANYYGAIVPYRCCLTSKSAYLKDLNSYITQYYTNPLIHLSNSAAQKLAWQDTNAQTLPYSRGFSYFTKVNAQIRKASHGKRSVDDIILELLKRSRAQEPYGAKQWVSLLTAELGASAIAEFNAMDAGEVITLAADCLAPDVTLLRHDQEVLDWGFNDSSYRTRVISGLKAGSRAAIAGLKEGDQILKNTFLWQVQGDFERNMVLLVRREGVGELEIEYWPRSWEKVESYQWVET